MTNRAEPVPGTFSTPFLPVPVPGAGGLIWSMHEPFAYTTRAGVTYDVEQGFQTDLASIPRPLWSFYPPMGGGKGKDYARAAVIHDRLCRLEVEQGLMTWDQAAAVWGEMLKACKVTAWNRFWLYRGVKWFGYIRRKPAAFSAPVKARMVTPVMHIRFRGAR